MKLHHGNCSEHHGANNPRLSCWAIRDESGRKICPDELMVILATIQDREVKLGQALEEIVCAHSLLKPETYHSYSLTKALEALGRA